MSSTAGQGASGDNSTFQPDPPQKAAFWQVMALFIYHVVLAVLLTYAIYNVWPPQPWPEDPRSTASANRANTNSAAGRTGNQPTNTNLNTNSAAPTNTNAGAGLNVNSTPVANTNSATPSPAGRPPAESASDVTQAVMSPSGDNFPPPFTLFGRTFQPPLETRLLLLVLLAGAIGSYVHAASSLVDYLGNRTFISSWVWWYLLRPFIGMMLALVFYFVFRGGFITAGFNQGGDAAASFINPFGIAAVAGLVGMFSKVAADKLNELFTTLFRPAPGQGDEKRGDKLSAGVTPAVTAVTPAVGPATGGAAVTITGQGFMEGATVTFGGVPATAVTVNGPTSLTAVTPAHAAGPVDVEVTNTNTRKGVLKNGFTYQ